LEKFGNETFANASKIANDSCYMMVSQGNKYFIETYCRLGNFRKFKYADII